MDIVIRQEVSTDYFETEKVVQAAFMNEEMSDQQEHQLVKRLRDSEAFIPELSLVAVDQEQNIVGHVLLTTNEIVKNEESIESLSLAPASVLPAFQNIGVGTQLMNEVLKRAKELGYKSVIVLGHAEYYRRFGFKPASIWKIEAPYDVPDEAFMALELVANALENVEGVVQYPKAFNE